MRRLQDRSTLLLRRYWTGLALIGLGLLIVVSSGCKGREEPDVIVIPDPPRPTVDAKPVGWMIGPDGYAKPIAWVLGRRVN